jgi:hypothetical protein
MSASPFRAAIAVLAIGALSSESLFAQHPNDTCATAAVASNGSNAGTTFGASTGPDPLPTCPSLINDVWFSYTATCTGVAIASLCPPGSGNFDTVMAAWSGSCGCLNEVACNDDFCSLRSKVQFNVVQGQTYYISIGGFDGDAGSFVLDIQCAPVNPPPVIPANDLCSNATGIAENVMVTSTNVNATSGGGACPGDPLGQCSLVANDVWYAFVPSCTTLYEARTCVGSTNFDTVVTVWDGSGGCGSLVEVGCNDDAGCPTPGQSLSSITQFYAQAGNLYYVSVGGFLGGTGTFDLLVSQASALTLLFVTPAPGTLGYFLTGGVPNGIGFVGVTTDGTNFPTGPFFGIDLSNADLLSQIAAGVPFLTTLSPCGTFFAGPYGGLPSGFTIYAVALSAPQGFNFPTKIGTPMTATTL